MLTKTTYKVAGRLLAYGSVIADSTVLDDAAKQDLFSILTAFGSLLDDPSQVAADQVALMRDVEIAAAQFDYYAARAEDEMDRVYAIEYLNARHDRKGEKITEELLKSTVLSVTRYINAQERFREFQKLSTLLQGLKKNLYSRAEMIKVLARRDEKGDI